MPISDTLYDKSMIKIVARIDKLSDDLNSSVKENASAIASINESIGSLADSIEELTKVIKGFYDTREESK